MFQEHHLVIIDCHFQFTDEKALYIASKVTEAVLYMHHHDPIVIHQDIKPQNVLVRCYNHGIIISVNIITCTY